jgi:type IV pilus assembly protein PilN
MIRINLLPHREEKRQARKKQFITLAAITAALAVALCAIIWYALSVRLEAEKERVKYLEGETARLEKLIVEIAKIREETASLLSKKQVVESLQTDRSEAVHLFDQLLKQLPEGLYLHTVKQTGKKVEVIGYAQSNARVSSFMRNIQSSPYIENPELVVIKAQTVANVSANEFTLKFNLKASKTDDKPDLKKASTAPKVGGAK